MQPSLLKKIRGLLINPIVNTLLRLEYLTSLQHLNELKKSPKYLTPRHLIPFGSKAFSQGDEDGIIREIFQRIGLGADPGIFVEIGVGDGLENNTLNLLFNGWKGIWIDGSVKQCNFIKKKFASQIQSKNLSVLQQLIYRHNITEILDNLQLPAEIGLFSLDIDGNDHHVMSNLDLKKLNPRLIAVEYNAKFLPYTSWVMPYKEDHIWDNQSDYFGCSLRAWAELLNTKGYSLVGCSVFGTNAFFVRNDLVGENFCEVNNVEFHWEPARYYLIGGYRSGHPCNQDPAVDYFG